MAAISRTCCAPNSGPYGHVRFNLNGDPLFLPAKLAVSLALIFHELATNAGKYGAFSSARGLLQVSWSVSDDRLNVTWDETEGPAVEKVGAAGFGTKLLQSALRAVRRQDRDPLSEDRRSLHDAMPDPAQLNALAFARARQTQPQLRAIRPH